MRNAKAALRNAALRLGLAVLLLTALERDAPLRDEAAKLALTVGPGTTIAEKVPSATPPSRPGFLRLSLAGENVAWTKANNTHVKLSYAILTRDRSTRDAINCASMKPPAHALASSGISDAAFRSELQAAFAMWSLVAAVDFVETTDEAAADILFGAQAEPSGHAFTNVTPAAPGSGRIAKAMVCLSPGSAGKSASTAIYRFLTCATRSLTRSAMPSASIIRAAKATSCRIAMSRTAQAYRTETEPARLLSMVLAQSSEIYFPSGILSCNRPLQMSGNSGPAVSTPP